MDGAADYISQILPHGFESFELTMWAYIGELDLPEIAKQAVEAAGDQAFISSVGIYGNPLQDEKTAKDWETVIKQAKLFGAKQSGQPELQLANAWKDADLLEEARNLLEKLQAEVDSPTSIYRELHKHLELKTRQSAVHLGGG